MATQSASSTRIIRRDRAAGLAALNQGVTFDGPFLSVAGLLVVALLFGGGGPLFPLSEMFVQLAALPALYFGLFAGLGRERASGHCVPIVLLLMSAALVIVQLIPLPPTIWQALPGRAVLVDIAQATGLAANWYPLSIEPELTFRAGLQLVVPAGIILAGARLTQAERVWLLGLVIILTGVNFLVAGLQLSSGGTSFYPYATSHKGLPLGMFANRNHFALLILLALVAAVAILNFYRAEQRPAPVKGKAKMMLDSRLILLATGGLVAAAVIMATGSRTVSVLFVLSILPLALLAVHASKWSKALFGVALAGLGVGAVLYAMIASGRFEVANRLMERFALQHDERFEFWPDALNAIKANFPVGTGMGTFDTAFRMVERLDHVGQRYVNNAHNDYLEVAIEAGLPGLVIFAAFLVWLAVRSIALARSKESLNAIRTGWCAAFALLLVSLHSLSDYPVRRLAIMAVCTLFVSILAAAGRGSEGAKASGATN